MMARILREPPAALDHDLFALINTSQIVVPGHWPTEIANALRTNIRRGRITPSEIEAVASFLAMFEITVNAPLPLDEIGPLTSFSLTQQLTAYDAAYVQLALDRGARLATLDQAMRAAAQRLNVPLLPA